ncbi:hypothetical protein HCH_03360 [Hahella chejuensis KCTC 2396]|uniref:Uncharacterized protein n=1 Tax=Hahella chejuensis (strain KCTC 2396) TaxID=349521 RepID=Q2SGW0_HAHCH|nr:hypothetical protein [Hahella chejuensis]ABC30114.1 hypothetical protein HCH_03360 [Hahella chejuensis KCTC 2396]
MNTLKKEADLDMHVIGETYPSKVAVVFDTKETADEAIDALVTEAGFSRQQIKLINPNDRQDVHLGANLEPENKGILATMIRSHVVIGGGIVLLSILLAWLLVTAGPPATQSSPGMTFLGVCSLGLFLGLILGGAVALRPDHDLVIAKIRMGKDAGKWGVVVHTSHDDKKLARQTLARFSNTTVESL